MYVEPLTYITICYIIYIVNYQSNKHVSNKRGKVAYDFILYYLHYVSRFQIREITKGTTPMDTQVTTKKNNITFFFFFILVL